MIAHGRRLLSRCVLAVSVLLAATTALFAAPDLPGPSPNLRVIPSGSLIVAMDNDKQNVGVVFNLRAYGLVTHLLHNDIPVDWAIRAGKVKDGIDFSASARRVYPAPALATSTLDFRGGPFIIHRDFASFAIPWILAFGSNVAVYELMADATIDVRFTLLHKPKVAVFDDGGNAGIHEDLLDEAGFVTPTHYGTILATSLATVNATTCLTIGTEPHWGETPTDPDVTAAARAIRDFVEAGGNFLAQCDAIATYENNPSQGRYQTTAGIIVNNTGDSPFLYPQADLPFSQFEGALASGGGSIHDWSLAGGSAWQNGGHFQVQNTPQTTLFAGTVSKLTAGTGSLVHYLGTHSFGDNSIPQANGRRMYLNAVMTPAARPANCLLNLVLRTIAGTVYEDVNGDAGLGDALPATQVLVRLYADNNDDGTVDPADTYISRALTSASGSFEFMISQGLTGTRYLVAVDSKSVATASGVPGAAFNGGFGAANVWAEQTYGDDPGTGALDLGPRYGGRVAGVSDSVNAASSAAADNAYQHLARVDVGSGNVSGVDFAFSFNVVTHPRDGDDDGAAARSIQGSLRQFLQNANAVSGGNGMRFVPVVATNSSGGGGDWWQVAVSGSALPPITDADAIVDGTAFCGWDDGTQGCAATSQVRDDNPGQSGNPDFPLKAVGTGPDALEGTGDEPLLPDYERPELEIDGSDLGTVFDVAAADATIRRVAVFNTPPGSFAARFTGGAGGLFSENFVGLRADGADPGAGLRLDSGVSTSGGTTDIAGNLLGFTEQNGLLVAASGLISGNELYSIALSDPDGDGISTEGSSGQAITIRENRIDRSSAFAIESWDAPGPFTIEDNTVSRSGLGSAQETGGIRIFGTGSIVRHNVVTGSAGAGVVLVQRGAPGSNRQNLVSRNSIHTNGGPSIDIDGTNTGAGDNPAGDGVTGNDGLTDPTLPNIDQDYPIFTSVLALGNSLYVKGYIGTSSSRVAGTHTIEVFKADDDGGNDGEVERLDGQNVPHGEARWFIDDCASAADGSFACSVTIPGALAVGPGDSITASAIDADGNTSEMGPNAEPALPQIVKRAFQIDGTPIPDGSALPAGQPVKFLLYINNPGPPLVDVSLQDVLDPVFLYQPGSARYDNSTPSCAVYACTAVEEAAILAAADGGTAGTDAEDGDVINFTGVTLDMGNRFAAGAQLDLAADSVWAVVFTVQMQ